MHVVLVTEIWGRTSCVNLLVDAFKGVSKSVSVVDPYGGVDPQFADEDAAYARYLKECGHGRYAEHVYQELLKMTAPVCVVGFSAGAGAVWSAVTEGDCGYVCGAICFYGSSIRSMVDRTPLVQTDLIFPHQEPHFNVDEVIQSLEGKDFVQCHKTQYDHGFMNPLSDNFNAKGYESWLVWTRKRVAAMFL